MNTSVEAQASILDVVKQVASAAVVVAAIVGFYYFSDVPLLYRVIGLIVLMLLVLGLLATTHAGKNIWGFFLESKQEVRKVVWPSREETTRTTMLVFAMVFAVGLILWLLDMFLFWGVRFLTGQG
jgi:preprotein translocase subunit SecE